MGNSTFSLLCNFLEEEEDEHLLEEEEKALIKDYREESLLKLSDKVLPRSYSDIELGKVKNKKYVPNHIFKNSTDIQNVKLRFKDFDFDQEKLYYLAAWIYQSIFKGFLDIKGQVHEPALNEYAKVLYEDSIPFLKNKVDSYLYENNTNIFDLKEEYEIHLAYWQYKRLERKTAKLKKMKKSTKAAYKKYIKSLGKNSWWYDHKTKQAFVKEPMYLHWSYFKNMQKLVPDIQITHGYINNIRNWKFLFPALIQKLIAMKCLNVETIPKMKIKVITDLNPRLRYYYIKDNKKYDRQKRMPGFEILKNDEILNLKFDNLKNNKPWELHLERLKNGELKKYYHRNNNNNFISQLF